MKNTMSIYAEALVSNRSYKNARVDGNAVGVDNARAWKNLVLGAMKPAYEVRKYRYDNMGKAEEIASCDLSALFDAIRPIVNLIGEVNGDKLNAVNVAEEFVAHAIRFRVADISVPMAHARENYRQAKSKLNNFEQGELSNAEYALKLTELEHNFELCEKEVKRLEGEPGNCKRIAEIQSDSAFVRAIEIALGDAILKQTLRPYDEIVAEREKREADRKAKRKANKQAKKSAK